MIKKVRFWLFIGILTAYSTSEVLARTPQPVATNCAAFIQNIKNSEGSGNYSTNTGNGYYGAYQLGDGALIDTGYMDRGGNWTGKNGINSLEDFLSNKDVQDQAFLEYGEINLGYIGNYQQYIGRTIGGVVVTRAGLIAAAHLVGYGGARYWLTSGGDCTNHHNSRDAVDGNGTCAGTYMYENQVNDDCSNTDLSSAPTGTCFASLPVENMEIYSDYGAWNRAGVSGGNNGWHRGLDIRKVGASQASQVGEPILAVQDGSTQWGGAGFMMLKHADGSQTRYIHLSKREEGRKDVKAGEKIAEMGHTGAGGPSGTHLHFEYLVPGTMLGDNGSVVLPLGSGKRDKSAALTASQIANALPDTLYYTNPETFLPERVPMVGSAAARQGRTQSLPNTCSMDRASLEQPRSSSGQVSPAESIRAEADFRGGEIGTGQEQAFLGQKSLWVDFARMIALDVKTEQMNNRAAMDTGIAHTTAAILASQATENFERSDK